MTIPSPADDSLNPKCLECGAAISSKAKFCEECGAIQTASPTGSAEQVGKVLPDSTVSGIEPQTSENLLLSSATTNHTSNPTEVGNVDGGSSKQKKFFMICGIAAVVIVLACIGAWYLRAAERQKATDNYNLGLAYENGQGVAKDDAQAAYWYRKAADHGNADAQEELGEMYENGRGGLAKDDAQAVPWYRKSADQGNAAAQNNLGVAYATGRGGLAKDDAQAVSWYQKAAALGNADAQFNLGASYANGLGGLAEDDAQAVFWYQKAANQGEADAEYWLGVMYEYGRGGLAEDNAQALSWFQKAADQGYALAKDAPDRMQREQQEQARMEALMGTPTDFASLYALAYATGMEAGKRYQLDASFNSELTLLFPPGRVGDSLSIDRDFDDSNQLEAVMRMAASRPLGVTCRVVVSMGYDRLHINRAENCRYNE